MFQFSNILRVGSDIPKIFNQAGDLYHMPCRKSVNLQKFLRGVRWFTNTFNCSVKILLPMGLDLGLGATGDHLTPKFFYHPTINFFINILLFPEQFKIY